VSRVAEYGCGVSRNKTLPVEPADLIHLEEAGFASLAMVVLAGYVEGSVQGRLFSYSFGIPSQYLFHVTDSSVVLGVAGR